MGKLYIGAADHLNGFHDTVCLFLNNKEELSTVCARGLQASLVGQVLVEESILGWEELELEVVRDADGNMITVCFIENIDPCPVYHTFRKGYHEASILLPA